MTTISKRVGFTCVLHDLHPIDARGQEGFDSSKSKYDDDYFCVECGRISSNSHVVHMPFSSTASLKLF